jgi:hypothetical protein
MGVVAVRRTVMADVHIEPADACSTTDSFANYGITDGSDLISRAARALGSTRQDVTVTPELTSGVESAFRTAFLAESDDGTLPSTVTAALDDAAVLVVDRFGGETRDLRTDVLPAFYREFAGYHCAYRVANPPAHDAFDDGGG